MLVKNRKTGVVLKATPRLVARAIREAHFELIEDDDFLDLQEVRAILAASKQADEPGVEEILTNLEQTIKEKLVKRKTAAKGSESAPKKEAKKEPAKDPQKDPGKGADEFSEIEAKVQSLIGDEKDKDHKDALEAMARETFGVELDKRKNLSTLKQEVLNLIAEHRAG